MSESYFERLYGTCNDIGNESFSACGASVMPSGDQSADLRSVGFLRDSGRLRTLCDQLLQPSLVIFAQEKAKFFKKVSNFFKKVFTNEKVSVIIGYNKVVS